jgi:DNA (cytosine-5)-methyltransferase 1
MRCSSFCQRSSIDFALQLRTMPIPVIDLFAGPGGLGEGFSSLLNDEGQRVFTIKLSIEKDAHAHQTLVLRAFFRQFAKDQRPNAYYDYVTGRISAVQLFKAYPKAAEAAAREAWCAELGSTSTPDTEIDRRLKEALGSRSSWVLIGGPPCQAYSLVGRSRVIGREGLLKYEADPKHRLYRHYLRILATHRPPVFVMENVKGLLSAKIKEEGIFQQILTDLRRPDLAIPSTSTSRLEYRLVPLAGGSRDLLGEFHPEDFVVRSEDYGVPQTRHRIIIVGIRGDLRASPSLLSPVSSATTIEDVIADLPRLRSGLSKELDSPQTWRDVIRTFPLDSFNGALSQQVVDALRRSSERVGLRLTCGSIFVPIRARPKRFSTWFYDSKLGGVCNHESRGHIRSDLHRYFFAAVFAKTLGRSPLLEDFPAGLLPNHQNVADALKETKFNDRFRVQMAGRPATTVVSHISKDGHYYIHYDPSQCRSLTVREAARLQTFPDNYFFEGPRTEQYKQVGNAVPPLLAKQIAEIVAAVLQQVRPCVR